MKKNRGFNINDICRLRTSPNYSYFKITGFEKINGYICAIGEHTINKNENFGFKRKYRIVDLIKEKI